MSRRLFVIAAALILAGPLTAHAAVGQGNNNGNGNIGVGNGNGNSGNNNGNGNIGNNNGNNNKTNNNGNNTVGNNNGNSANKARVFTVPSFPAWPTTAPKLPSFTFWL